MGDWEVIESVVEYETGWYTGGYDLLEQPDGSTKRYYWAELPPAAIVVAIAGAGAAAGDAVAAGGPEGCRGDATAGREVVFVEQFRPAVGETFLELPAGIVEEGETFAEAGARELREETGYRADEVETLETFWVATGVLRHRRGVVVATDLEPGEVDHDGNEFLSVTSRPIGDALSAAREAPRSDATLEGLLLAADAGHL